MFNATYSIAFGPSAAYVAGCAADLSGGLGGGLHGGEGVAEGGRATWYPTFCIGLGQQGRICYSIAVATKRLS